MGSPSKKFAISLVAVGLLSFATLSLFGLGHFGGMETNKDGNMDGCVFTGKTMLCKMSVVEHISLWQSMFTAMPQESLMLVVLMALLITAVALITKNTFAPPHLSKNDIAIGRLYLKEHPDLSFFNPLKEAFSQGILNPKIYSSAN